jgi:hypothetical protein
MATNSRFVSDANTALRTYLGAPQPERYTAKEQV